MRNVAIVLRAFGHASLAFAVAVSAKPVAIMALTGFAALSLGISDWRTIAYPSVGVLWLTTAVILIRTTLRYVRAKIR